MNKTVARFFTPFIFLSAVCACGTSGDASPSPPLFGIELGGNPTTGYLWSWQAEPPDGVREAAEAEYRRDGEPPSKTDGEQVQPPRVGQGGTFTFRFEKLIEGDVVLTFSYARPWETGKPAAEIAVFVVSGMEKLTVARK